MFPILADVAGPQILFVFAGMVVAGAFLVVGVVFVGLRIARWIRGSQPPENSDSESES